ncbi:hypothetical protein L3N51_01121 [Metallosphaera sp. J1]|nr:hypothetical protein [Metallosphaera javensis (ex Hofmann et al. 2022)]
MVLSLAGIILNLPSRGPFNTSYPEISVIHHYLSIYYKKEEIGLCLS